MTSIFTAVDQHTHVDASIGSEQQPAVCVYAMSYVIRSTSTIIPSLVIFHLLPIFTSSVLVFEALICITIAREWCALT